MYMNTERKRKLVSLYHETEDFVTLENLSSYIDDRFASGSRSAADVRNLEETAVTLGRAVDEQHRRPKMVVATHDSMAGFFNLGSPYRDAAGDIKEERKEKLRNAVYSVDDKKKTGVEMVEKYMKGNER